MLVIYLEGIEDFIQFLERRTMNEVFCEARQLPGSNLISVALNFLGKVNEQTVLFETCIETRGERKMEEILKEIKAELQNVNNIRVIQGKIREIYYSLS